MLLEITFPNKNKNLQVCVKMIFFMPGEKYTEPFQNNIPTLA